MTGDGENRPSIYDESDRGVPSSLGWVYRLARMLLLLPGGGDGFSHAGLVK